MISPVLHCITETRMRIPYAQDPYGPLKSSLISVNHIEQLAGLSFLRNSQTRLRYGLSGSRRTDV